MQKRRFSMELAYILGLVILVSGTALMERADFGVSMVVAPAYLLHLKLSETYSFFTFGMAEYLLQFVLLVALCVIRRRVKLSYVFSFVTAVLYGFILDGIMLLTALLPVSTGMRIAEYFVGLVLCSIGVAMLFNTYLAPEAYEVFVKELAEKLNKPIPKVKTVYDCASCAAAILMSFAFFGFGTFRGVWWGTAFCALVNGSVIGLCSKFMERRFEFVRLIPPIKRCRKGMCE